MKKIKNCIHCFDLLFSQLCSVRVALTGSALRCSYNFFASKKEAKVPCKHFGEESICSIMFFFSNQSSFVPFSTIQLCSPALCPSLTKAWIVFRAKFCTPASFGGNESPVRRTCRFEPEDITQHVTRCIYLSTYFSDVEMEFLVCTCHVRLIFFFCISQILLLGFLTTHLAQKTWYQFNIIWN